MLLLRIDKKAIFKISGKLSGNGFIQNSRAISRSKIIRGFVDFRNCYIILSDVMVNLVQETFMAKNHIYFLPPHPPKKKRK